MGARHDSDSAPRSISDPPLAGAARAADRLANERTFLAWIRTSLSLITFGFVIAKFSVWLRQFAALATLAPSTRIPAAGASLPAGLALMTFGAVVAGLALHRYRMVDAALTEGRYPSAHSMMRLVTAVIVLVALALIGFLATTSQWL